MANEVTTPAQARLNELLADAKAAKTGTTPNQLAVCPNKIVLIEDTSGSMEAGFGKTTRIRAAIMAMRRIIGASNARDTAYSLITFDSDFRVVLPMGSPYSKFMGISLSGGGGTTLAPPLQASLDQNPSRVIILTDGQAWDSSYCLEIARNEYAPKGVKIDCVAIGDANDEFLTQLCEITGGKFRRAKDEDELTQIFISFEPANYLRLEHKS